MTTLQDLHDIETRVTDEATGGQKGAKQTQLGALDPASLIELARVAGMGADKYDAFNFLKGYDYSLSFNALMRHALLFWAGEDLDAESGYPHMAHVAWHGLTLVAFLARDIGNDDRPPRLDGPRGALRELLLADVPAQVEADKRRLDAVWGDRPITTSVYTAAEEWDERFGAYFPAENAPGADETWWEDCNATEDAPEAPAPAPETWGQGDGPVVQYTQELSDRLVDWVDCQAEELSPPPWVEYGGGQYPPESKVRYVVHYADHHYGLDPEPEDRPIAGRQSCCGHNAPGHYESCKHVEESDTYGYGVQPS